MKYTVFFAYQSDISAQFGKDFIVSALDLVKAKLQKQNIELIIDFGFRGESGNTPLLETMLDKSRDADITIVDLTYTSAKEWLLAEIIEQDDKNIILEIPKGDRKPSPNPNVLLETGFAWALKGANRTILVMNEAFGTPDLLPVDLKGFRWPVIYNLRDENYNENTKVKEQLIKDLYKAIMGSLESEEKCLRDNWKPILLYNSWKTEINHKNPFHLPDQYIVDFQKLAKNITQSGSQHRIVGPKGVGKTRFVFELFTNKSYETVADQLSQVLYYDLNLSNYSSIENGLMQIRETNQKKILVIDNCDIEHRNRIFGKCIKDTQNSLITIYCNENPSSEIEVYLDYQYANSIIKKLASDSNLNQYVTKIIQESNSNLNNAIQLMKFDENGECQIMRDDKNRWEVLLGKDLIANHAIEIIENLSLFTSLGFSGYYELDSNIITSQITYLSIEQYKIVINKLIEKDVVIKRGDFIFLKAYGNEIAEAKLKSFMSGDRKVLINDIVKFGLAYKFGSKLLELAKAESTRQAVEDFILADDVMQEIEFINNEQGANILLFLAEVSPERVERALVSKFLTKDIESLKRIHGRQSIINTLQKLVFNKNFFESSAKILYKLALAENEIYLNNATGQFAHLFNIVLSGTEVDLKTRVALLKELKKDVCDGNYHVLTVAIQTGLRTRGFMRVGSYHEQAHKVYRDYYPQDEKERNDYWGELIEILLDIDTAESEKVIADSFISQFDEGNSDKIFEALEVVIKKDGKINKDFRDKFDFVLNERVISDHNKIEKVRLLYDKYQDKSIKGRLESIVSLAPYTWVVGKRGEEIDLPEKKSRELAHELMSSNDTEWLDYIEVLLFDEQRHTNSFGNEIAQYNPEFTELFDSAFKILQVRQTENQNIDLLFGYFRGSQSDHFKRGVIQKYLQDVKTKAIAIKLFRFLDLDYSDVVQIYTKVKDDAELLYTTSFYDYKNLTEEQLTTYITDIRKIEPIGVYACINVFSNLLKEKVEVSTKILDLIQVTLKYPGLLQHELVRDQLIDFRINQIIERISAFRLNADFVVFLTEEVMSSSLEFRLRNYTYIKELLQLLLENYWELSWPIVVNYLADYIPSSFYRLEDVLNEIIDNNQERILIWLAEDPVNHPQVIARFMNVVIQNEGKTHWSPICRKMISLFGSNTELLSQITSKLFSWRGISAKSVILLLNERKALVEDLLKNDNPIVQEFAKSQLPEFDLLIAEATKDEENDKLNYS